MNIALVDDDIDDVLLFRQAIKDINRRIDCVEFENGADLLNYLFVAPSYPTMIFLDFNMPGMNGYETCTRMRRTLKDTIILAFTGIENDEIKRHAKEAGFDDIILKENIDDVQEKIKTLSK